MSLKRGVFNNHITASEAGTTGITPKMGVPGEYRVETHQSYAGVYRLLRADPNIPQAGIGAFDPVQWVVASDWTVNMLGRFSGVGGTKTAAVTNGLPVPVAWWYHPHSNQEATPMQGSYLLDRGAWAWFKVAGTAAIAAIQTFEIGANVAGYGEVATTWDNHKVVIGQVVEQYSTKGGVPGIKVVISCAS